MSDPSHRMDHAHARLANAFTAAEDADIATIEGLERGRLETMSYVLACLVGALMGEAIVSGKSVPVERLAEIVEKQCAKGEEAAVRYRQDAAYAALAAAETAEDRGFHAAVRGRGRGGEND
jgi:hypothetical protein